MPIIQLGFKHLKIVTVDGVEVIKFADKSVVCWKVARIVSAELLGQVTLEPTSKFVLDFLDVEGWCEDMFVPLVTFVRRVKRLGARIEICNVSGQPLEVMKRLQIFKLFHLREGVTLKIALKELVQ